MQKRLILAIQKSGRLHDASMKLIRECGIDLNGKGKFTLRFPASNFPLEILYLRDDDIPEYVGNGTVDIGIVGENIFREKDEAHTRLIQRLGFSKCRLSIAIPRGKNDAFQSIGDLANKTIATSHPHLLRSYLADKGVPDVHIDTLHGSVEVAPGLGLADAICDLVSTGTTLESHGLKEFEVIAHSEAVLIGRADCSDETQAIIDRLIFRIKAVQRARRYKYIVLNAPTSALPAIKSVIPGMKSPSAIELTPEPGDTESWVAIHSVVDEDVFWEKIEELMKAGARDILVMPIEKMIR